MVRKAIRENKDAKIIVTGCAAKTSSKYFSEHPEIFKVIQNDEKGDITSYLDLPHSSDEIENSWIVNETDDPLFKDKARAFLQIQNGCNHFCSYCIVPFTRGRVRSLPLEEVLKRVGYFIDHGFKEIVLSGIDITSYGKDLENTDLSDVIEAILKKYPSQNRIRISSIDPAGIDERLLGLFINEKRIMPHFHFSIQSGDNDVLKAMRRRHAREDIIRICNEISKKRPKVVFGSDFIAGFPTETEIMFQNTLKLIDEANLSLMHIFPYSPRSGTLAASMIQIPRNVILERAKILREKADETLKKLLDSLVGKDISGIIEKVEYGNSFGKTDSFLPFKIKEKLLNSEEVVGNFKVMGVEDNLLILE
jgi:threonylcarbamoyladenosine tRNA methylthiotransferase MtaB